MEEARFIALMDRYMAGEASEAQWKELSDMVDSGRYDGYLRRMIEAIYEEESRSESQTGQPYLAAARLQSILDHVYGTARSAEPDPAASGNNAAVTPLEPAAAGSSQHAITAGETSGAISSQHAITAQEPDAAASQQDEAPAILMHADRERPQRRIPRWSAAAAILILIAAGTVLYLRRPAKPEIAQTPSAPRPAQNDVAPGGQKAMLTLADGSTILLDSARNGLLARQNGTRVEKLSNGQIVYKPAGSKPGETSYNTMATPRGGQYQLRLPDGSVVWLNASSSITYPTAFTNNKREITMTGEAYFEIVRDASKPFIVRAGTEEISVLGTSFNVNSYKDEPSPKTTLLDGSVRVSRQTLHPGEACVNGKVTKTDVEQDVAWKNGRFNFQDRKLVEVMRQLSRWYDIEIVYDQGIPDIEFGGEMDRGLSLGQVLKGLESAEVHFSLAGKKLIVRP